MMNWGVIIFLLYLIYFLAIHKYIYLLRETNQLIIHFKALLLIVLDLVVYSRKLNIHKAAMQNSKRTDQTLDRKISALNFKKGQIKASLQYN